jgi:GAF domain-containing protein
MRSRGARLTVAALACLALAVAAFFLIQSEQQIADDRAAVRAFDLHAREAADALADLRAGEQAYVAEGQGVAFWMPRVATTIEAVGQAIESLLKSADSSVARSALQDAAGTIVEFAAIDKRARDYITAGQTLMAGDVIFTEGGTTAATAARQIESARLAEHQAVDQSEGALRKDQTIVLGVAGGLLGLCVLLLIPGKAPAKDLSQHPQPSAEPAMAGRAGSPVLRMAATLCTEFGRVRDLADLQLLLGRAAAAMDASGLVVWLGNSAGADLRPVLAHGYPPQTLARMPSVLRSDENAAAAAYRTGELQLVLSRLGSPETGAVVAPILSTDGCIGALSAEIRGGGEGSEEVQALASIFAAQLSTILASPSATAEAEPKAAGSAGL